jgi:hypothetical protein
LKVIAELLPSDWQSLVQDSLVTVPVPPLQKQLISCGCTSAFELE